MRVCVKSIALPPSRPACVVALAMIGVSLFLSTLSFGQGIPRPG